MNKLNDGLERGSIWFCCELMRISGTLYGLSYAIKHEPETVPPPRNPNGVQDWADAFGNRKDINDCVLDLLQHDMDALDGAAQGPLRIKTPEHCINLGVLHWWDSITANATMVRMVTYGNKSTNTPCDLTMSAKFLEKRDNQEIVEIICDSAASAEQMAEQLRNNLLWEIKLGGPVLQILHDDGLTVHAFGLSDGEIAAMSKTHEMVAPCRWERGISIHVGKGTGHFGEDTSLSLGRPDSFLRFVQIGRTVELRGPARSASITYASEDVAAKAFHELQTKPRSRLAVGDDIERIYCQTRNRVYAEGISIEERERLDATCHQIMAGQWRLGGCC